MDDKVDDEEKEEKKDEDEEEDDDDNDDEEEDDDDDDCEGGLDAADSQSISNSSRMSDREVDKVLLSLLLFLCLCVLSLFVNVFERWLLFILC